MEVLGTRPTRGGIFTPATVEGNVYRRLPAQIILVRPKDKGWPRIVAEWNDLKRRESAVGRPVPMDIGTRTLDSWTEISAIAKPGKLPKGRGTATPDSFVPVLGQVGLCMDRWLERRRQRVILEQAVARQLALQRGTIHVEGQPDLQVLLRTMPDGKTHVIVFGEE